MKGLEHEPDLVPADPGGGGFVQRIQGFAVDGDTALGGAVQAGQEREQGGFAGPRGPGHGHEFPRVNGHVQAFENLHRPAGSGERFAQTRGAEDRGRWRGHRRSGHRDRARERRLIAGSVSYIWNVGFPRGRRFLRDVWRGIPRSSRRTSAGGRRLQTPINVHPACP